eukprot:CAMPEP_0171258898 /NCGR_PEP_ID=MMETSP0790-20130122/54639_1 /TAXON_ID=2925 /ORGANISM="Alexandrium catenella, Strain OF101" /LENGTH=57 /DNA_ID=CAMNT_0011727135 /DNA_START=52 /DNA_END=222 /DNA_ORIENTATION=-
MAPVRAATRAAAGLQLGGQHPGLLLPLDLQLLAGPLRQAGLVEAVAAAPAGPRHAAL